LEQEFSCSSLQLLVFFAALRENNLHAEAQRLRKGRKRKLYEVTVI
jgi:hypothetical protein